MGGATEPGGDLYRAMVEKTVAQLQAKLLLTTEQLAKRGANKEKSSDAEWDAQAVLLMEEFVWVRRRSRP